MPDQFNPSVPAIPVSTEGSVLAMRKGCPTFVGGSTVIYNAGTPIGIPPSGTFGDNGALSALPNPFGTVYPAIYLFFPDDAIFIGSQAGLYYTQLDTDESGTVFNNVLSPGMVPVVIKNPTPFVCTGAGAYTQTTDLQTLWSFTLPGKIMRENGSLEIYNLYSFLTNGVAKTSHIYFGGQVVQQIVQVNAAEFLNTVHINNAGDNSRQVVPSPFGIEGGGSAPCTYLAVNTLNDVIISIDASMDTDFVFIVLEALTIKVNNVVDLPVGP